MYACTNSYSQFLSLFPRCEKWNRVTCLERESISHDIWENLLFILQKRHQNIYISRYSLHETWRVLSLSLPSLHFIYVIYELSESWRRKEKKNKLLRKRRSQFQQIYAYSSLRVLLFWRFSLLHGGRGGKKKTVKLETSFHTFIVIHTLKEETLRIYLIFFNLVNTIPYDAQPVSFVSAV